MTLAPTPERYAAAARRAEPAASPPSDDAVRAHLPLVRHVVRRLAARKPPHIEFEELVSWGIDGLLDAFTKYDARKEAAFATYAQFRIRGAILDRLRGLDWVSRGVRQKAAVLDRAYRQLANKLGRPASEEEVAEALGISLADLGAQLAEVGRMSLLSLEDLGIGGGGGEERLPIEKLLEGGPGDPMQAVLSRERVELVSQAVERLPEKERVVIALYYHEGLTMREVGAVLDLTESRVSQLHAQALLRLRGLLREHFGGSE